MERTKHQGLPRRPDLRPLAVLGLFVGVSLMGRMNTKLIVYLRAHRTKAGLTQAQLAAVAGVSRKTINTIENGVFTPSTTLALTLARELNCAVHDLFALSQ